MSELENFDVKVATSNPEAALFAERFAVGVFVGAATVSVVHWQNWWAASLAFTAFVLFLLFRWSRLSADPEAAESIPTKY